MSAEFDHIIDLYKKDPSLSIADLYESLAAQEKKSALGQYFTPPALADLLIDYAVRSDRDLVLEPACGCASIASRIAAKVVCVDRDPDVMRLSRLVLTERDAELYVSDMFDFKPELYGKFDAVVSNLPFVNKTKTDKSGDSSCWQVYRRATEKNLAEMGFKFEKMSLQMDLCALCTIHSTRYLRPGGRAALVLSGGWVTAQYGLLFQEFLKNAYKIVAICESQAEHWFPYAQVNACLLFLERCVDASERDSHLTSFLKLTRPVSSVSNLFRQIELFRRAASQDGMSLFSDESAEYTFYPQRRIGHG